MIIGDVAASEWLAGPGDSSRPSDHPADLCAPPAGARWGTLVDQPASLSRVDNGIFPGTAGKKALNGVG